MTQLLKIFFWGMIISFVGSLPLGTVNVTATNITVRSGIYDATLFSYGCLAVETICLSVVLAAMDWISKRQKIFQLFEWLTTALILILAIGSFIAAYQMKKFGNNIFTSYNIHPFILGLLLSSLNPLHIPFWFGWTIVLMNKGILAPNRKNNIVYTFGISIGTIAGFDVFIYGGNYLVRLLNENQSILNWIIGVVLLITALIQLYKIKYKDIPKPIGL